MWFKMKNHSITFQNDWQVYLFEEYAFTLSRQATSTAPVEFHRGFHFGGKTFQKIFYTFFFKSDLQESI